MHGKEKISGSNEAGRVTQLHLPRVSQKGCIRKLSISVAVVDRLHPYEHMDDVYPAKDGYADSQYGCRFLAQTTKS